MSIYKIITILVLLLLPRTAAEAQIVIGGSVYGGGNQGDTGGSTCVEVRAGDIGRVFGGARQANVGGSTFVHINGEHASSYILIDNVYGGNDVAGTIGTSATLPTALTEAGNNEITTDWNAFVRISTKCTTTGEGVKTEAADARKIYIGQLFGGGNGDYDYTLPDYEGLSAPALGKTYLELLGGSIVNAFGGGNKANVTGAGGVVICLDNPSEVVNHIYVKDGVETEVTDENQLPEGVEDLLKVERFKKMGFNYKFTYPNSKSYQIGNLFGGNNKVDMAIRPKWYLKDGKVRNLYSGGNEGHMTNPEGLLLEIQESSTIEVDNVYAGCRRADVRPKNPMTGEDVPNASIQLSETKADGTPYNFPRGFSARVLVYGGDINNVYGGNDISGNVYGGNAVGIYTSIRGNVYGGGNGSYSYTDNADLKDDMLWKDFYYNPTDVLEKAGKTATSEKLKSAEALNLFRPNAEQISVRIWGANATKPTLVGGAIYIGGNSATVKPQSVNPIENPKVHLKIGSNAIADNVFLGNNGEQMVDGSDEGVLARYAGNVTMADGTTTKDFSTMDLTDPDIFAKYMEGCAMWEIPSIVFDSKDADDPEDYADWSSSFGSIYCGGNVGSIIVNGKTTISFNHKINVFDKVVGGCNNANVPVKRALVNGTERQVCARYEGGYLTPGSNGPTVGDDDPIADKIELNLIGLNISPKRWKGTKDADGRYTSYELDVNGNRQLEWNVVHVETGEDIPETGTDYVKYRLKGGNVYGGCYNSGHIDGNVVINLKGTVIDRENMFAVTEEETGDYKLYDITQLAEHQVTTRNSGVILSYQGMDALGLALNVFGGGYGPDSEIWGRTTINLETGYTFQIFGGGENGAIGRGVRNAETGKLEYTTYDPRFSTYINMHGTKGGVRRNDPYDDPTMAEAEFIYGGGFEGTIIGDTHVYLGNGRLFNSFAGSCNADILGHTETYVGLNANGYSGFPWVRDHIYGGNDLGGQIIQQMDFSQRLSDYMKGTDIKAGIHDATNSLKAAAYTEYRRGRVEYIFGGCFGDYDYTNPTLYGDYINEDGSDKDGFSKPYLANAFVNFRPDVWSGNSVSRIYGAGQGHEKGVDVDKMQDRSYVLIDIPKDNGSEMTNFEEMEVFGSGSWCGLGMRVAQPRQDTPENFEADCELADQKYSAIIDLFRGNIKNVYGGSFNEGFTRRTVVNVPRVSTIKVQNLFGGAFGNDPLYPCDVYEAHVNYHSEDATVTGNIYGGNNSADRTLYGQVNIDVPVWQNKAKGYLAKVFGAGYGEDTWSQYTEVNLEDGAHVYEVYGGGHNGKVYNTQSLLKWAENEKTHGNELVLTIGEGYTDYGLDDLLVHATALGGKYNTNVHIKEGATVEGYAYGGGQGDSIKVKNGILGSGDVYGTTYIDLLGGTVKKDLYAAGTSGAVRDALRVTPSGFTASDETVVPGFTASTTAYIKGGTARNVYGGGWLGSVGQHEGPINTAYTADIPGETNVIIGDIGGTSFTEGIPAVQRNAYGGGEGGAVFGTANITLNNGYIGYEYKDGEYEEKINDETWTDHIGENRLYDSGCVFGGGYIDNSSVDHTKVTMWNGHVRNSLFGGGEIAAIGRGEANEDRSLKDIYKAGTTQVKLFDGYVGRDVFGGGRGYNNLGEKGTLYSDGFVFGKTLVQIHGGEVGTDDGVEQGYGNVFGGGDIGFVYSAYEKDDDTMTMGVGKKSGLRYDDGEEGYYYQYEGGQFVTDAGEKIMTEDCKVLIEPWCKKKDAPGGKEEDYVTIDALNQYRNKTDSRWGAVDDKGIIIHNAVFAGGNTSSGSDDVFANTTTVFGNATASIHDVYHRDLITIGTGHTGGLYGDGNLTFVDGYRGLNITNYGTDYYSISKEISYEEYEGLPDREAAYYELRYKCIQECTDNEGTVYKPERTEEGRIINASTITADELLTLFKDVKVDGQSMLDASGKPLAAYWVENGVCSRYAGRIMNTIQRADFCGVFGSRMVMQGAQDRVPEIVDYTNYTINRVREVSLNKKNTEITADQTLPADPTADQINNAYHGNYFGIYNIVNFLGGLTSDVDFGSETTGEGAVRTTDNIDPKYGQDAGTTNQTFYDWKKRHYAEQKRNNGNSYNQVALASGVYLELTNENGSGDGLYEKEWGYITGVVELDLINVQTGIGGGFVYARNEHGVRSKTNKKHITLTELNSGAVTRDDFEYTTADATKKEWQTSGNFVHSTQTIIDDCYNISGKYLNGYREPDGVPAHYWFIKGQVYVYDQYVSAYTGAPNAYSETVNIPLTITAASHGTMKLLDVKSNLFAYYATNNGGTLTPLQEGKKLVINEVNYEKNSPISYWDWKMLAKSEQKLFVDDTYLILSDCTIGSTEYKAGTVLTKDEYETLSTSGTGHTKPTVTQKKEVDGVEQDVAVDFDFVVRSSNNLSHDTGFILTYNVNNPTEWDKWYTSLSGLSKISKADYDKLTEDQQNGYEDGPTYHLISENGGVFGQQEYKVSNVIAKKVYDTYQAIVTSHQEALPDNQATFAPAYLVTKEIEKAIMNDGTSLHLSPGASLSATDFSETQWSAMGSSVAEAYLCTSTIQLTKTENIYAGTLMTLAEKNKYIHDYHDLAADIEELVVPAYYCTEAGNYGGDYYEPNKNYRGLEAWCSLSAADRQNFAFNYDALDLLIDPAYSKAEGQKYQYDGYETYESANAGKMIYSLERPVDYTATYNSDTDLTLSSSIDVKRGGSTISATNITKGDEITRTVYEELPNEKRHYAPVSVKKEGGDYYVVKTGFQHGETPYAVGQVIEESAYNSLGDDKTNVTKLTFASQTEDNTYYFCREPYTIGTGGTAVTSATGVTGATAYSNDGNVDIGVVISQATYNTLTNQQLNFTIHGIAPVETSTLYVSRASDINDLSTEKIITVIYQYDYEESDVAGAHITPISERHVVNIHIKFKSGVPTVEDISSPKIVLPGTSVSIRTPNVTPGAYEVTGGGWELFRKKSDAESHVNGVEYTPTRDPLYWYQNGYYLAYYALTYLGKTYSNDVRVSVANYHDLAQVMGDKEHHYYIDNEDVGRKPKIYINDYSGGDNPQNGLDLFRNLIKLSHIDKTYDATGTPVAVSGGELDGHVPLDLTHTGGAKPRPMRGGKYLEFYLRSNQDYSDTWTPVADGENECFAGRLHGDGYTISGLDHSLFNNLCGDVYNLGVYGSFTGAGIAETGDGYVENCWVSTTSTAEKTSKPVFGSPTITEGDESVRPIRIVNSYYMEEDGAVNPYTNHSGNYGTPTRKPAQSFYNGEVAYDLNGFYLNKRYYDNNTSWEGTKSSYQYFKANADGTLPEAPVTANYPKAPDAQYGDIGYVEERFEDGDFIYAGGSIPDDTDERLYVSEEGSGYYPIWPDDYLFFGQTLTYGHVDNRAHQPWPAHINKSGNRLTTTATSINRVYRAPAYFQSRTMDVAYYNPHAIFAAKAADGSRTAYPRMTAIDFTGSNGDVSGGYKQGGQSGKFYPPLLDNDGLTFFRNVDLTKNLLAYIPSATDDDDTTADSKTNNAVNTALNEPDYAESDEKYRTVAIQDPSPVYGHPVVLTKTGFEARKNHFLIDKQDFNAPMAYTLASDKRMFYQRTPDRFVDRTKGWQGVSLPFTAELVTTQTKGEITHFYSGSEESKNGTGKKIGHEYWLREFTGIDGDGSTPEQLKATMTYPTAQPGVTYDDKTYTNSFLWDYYYSNNTFYDRNSDEYPGSYYRYDDNKGYVQKYNGYVPLGNGTPYILGLPGVTYYEFDLSGNFEASTALSTIPEKLGEQTITFVSAQGETIHESDDEVGTPVTYGGRTYTFRTNYLNQAFVAGTVDTYVLNAEGSSYDVVPAASTDPEVTVDDTEVSAFRPYFTVATASSGGDARQKTRSIVFGQADGKLGVEEQPDLRGEDNYSLSIYAKRKKIVVESNLREITEVRIVNTAGITINTFDIEPGETVTTRINNSGVYIVQTTDGRYIKKLAVR